MREDITREKGVEACWEPLTPTKWQCGLADHSVRQGGKVDERTVAVGVASDLTAGGVVGRLGQGQAQSLRKGSACLTRIVSWWLVCLLLMGCASSSQAITNDNSSTRLLVFSKTTGFRHASIEDGLAAIRIMAAEHRVAIDATEDAATFTLDNLQRYKAVIFLSTSGTILDDGQKKAFEQYIHAGGGYVGIHSASDTEYGWSWYGQLAGAYFKSHPSHLQQANITVEDTHHVSTSMLPQKWERTDEWYNFRSNPRSHVHVLLTLNEATYQGGAMGSDHPISWFHDFDGGRCWYTGMGHTGTSFQEPLFRAHLWGGITYAANLKEQ